MSSNTKGTCGNVVRGLSILVVLWTLSAPLRIYLGKSQHGSGMEVAIEAVMLVLPASLIALALAFFIVRKKFEKLLAGITFLVFVLVCGGYIAHERIQYNRATILLNAADFQYLVGMKQESVDLPYNHSFRRNSQTGETSYGYRGMDVYFKDGEVVRVEGTKDYKKYRPNND